MILQTYFVWLLPALVRVEGQKVMPARTGKDEARSRYGVQ